MFAWISYPSGQNASIDGRNRCPRQIFIKHKIEGIIFSEGAKLATLTPNFYIGILWHLV